MLCCATDLAAEPTLGVCIPGNTDRLSSDSCRCTGTTSRECIGQCTGSFEFFCTGATVVDPAICGGLNDLRNISPNGCFCAVNGDCTGDCSNGICINGTSAPVCAGFNNLNNVSADGCPCAVNGDCIGDCDQGTRTCEAVIGAVAERQPTIVGMAERPVIRIGETTADMAQVSNLTPSDSSLRFTLHPNSDTACVQPLFESNQPLRDETPIVSDPFQPVAGGLYRWRVRYRGNAWNFGVASACSSVAQRVEVIAPLFTDGFESIP